MNADKPLPLLYSGQAGSYFGTEYEALPLDLPEKVREAGQLLSNRGLNYFGKLNCSQFSNVDVYFYGTPDGSIVVSLMLGNSGISGIDCVSKFADESYLTTTTTNVLHGAYDEQKLFRVSYPSLGVIELLEHHQSTIEDFERQHGAIQPIFADLLAVAKLVDEYTLRQQSNDGHGFLQFAGGLANVQMDRMMADNSDDEEDDEWDEDEDYDEDAIEYDLSKVSLLVRAILENNQAQVTKLIDEGAEINPSGWDVDVPLVAAVYKGNVETIDLLIAAGANLDQLDFSVNCRPLGMAIKQNRIDLIELLLDAGASPEGGDLEETALAVAVRKDNLTALRVLLEAGADPDRRMEDGYRVIMAASWQGNLEAVKLLVEYGVDVNAWSQGESAIDSAARNAHREVYNYLYPLLDEDSKRYADKHGEKEIAKAIKRKNRAANKLNEKLGDAALFGKLNKVKQLLNEGADPNAITECGKSPLMLAAMYGHKAAIETLLDAGADPNLQGDEEFDEGQTALMYIASSFFASNRAEVIKFLVERGADVNIQNNEGETALMLAGDFTDAVKALIEAGADLNLRDKEGNTAMMLGTWAVQQLLKKAGASEAGINNIALVEAVEQGDLNKVEQLLQAGAEVNHNDGAALETAAFRGHLAIVDRLIKAGADVNLGWKTGFTPIARAANEGYLEIVERLLAAGANPFQKCHDEESYDALEYAQLGKGKSFHKGQDRQAIIDRLSQRKNR